MKRLAMMLLAVVMVVGLGGCSKNKDADPVGTWVLNVDVGCNGSVDFNLVWHIRDNGNFDDSAGDFGFWSVAKDDITLTYPAYGVVLSGTVDGGSMTGTYTGGGGSGCWTAARTSTTP